MFDKMIYFLGWVFFAMLLTFGISKVYPPFAPTVQQALHWLAEPNTVDTPIPMPASVTTRWQPVSPTVARDVAQTPHVGATGALAYELGRTPITYTDGRVERFYQVGKKTFATARSDVQRCLEPLLGQQVTVSTGRVRPVGGFDHGLVITRGGTRCELALSR